MAKISAHGAIVGTVEYVTRAKRYMSDGVILKNDGFGWKLYGKVKPHLTPAEAHSACARQACGATGRTASARGLHCRTACYGWPVQAMETAHGCHHDAG